MSKLLSLLLITILLGPGVLACGSAVQRDEPDPIEQGGSDTVTSQLGECSDRRVAVAPTSIPPVVTRAAAEAANNRQAPQASEAVYGLVSISTGGSAATASVDDLLRDSLGQAIALRPAWVLIYRGVKIPIGRDPLPRGTTPLKTNITTLAIVVDAQKNEFLYGWSCAWIEEP